MFLSSNSVITFLHLFERNYENHKYIVVRIQDEILFHLMPQFSNFNIILLAYHIIRSHLFFHCN